MLQYNTDGYDYDGGEVRQKRISAKTKLNKNKFCKKNKLSGAKYGPHVYDNSGKYCIKCGHIKKEGQKYGFDKTE